MKGEYGNSLNKTVLLKGGGDGFSLVEILVALSIFFIIVFAFLALYTKSFSDVVYSGNKNKALYRAQQELEELIQSNGSDGEEELEINFLGLVRPIRIRGKIEQKTVQYGKENATISLFIPNRR